jgi:uncharacterized protein YecE (DUF72 family)
MVLEGDTMVNWLLGTQGFSYADWAGGFYPDQMTRRNYLGHYSRFFNAVEIDSSFYGTPRASSVSRWKTRTNQEFVFCAKTPRVITHEKGLVDVHRDMSGFIRTMRNLSEKLGVILIQFPPSFDVSNAKNLDAFLLQLPTDINFAVEFRHRSWHNLETEVMLRKRNVCWAGTDYPGMPRGITQTTDFLYIRWMGPHGRFERYDREQVDVTEQLEWWWDHLQEHLEYVDTVYGFFSDDYAGFAPGTCNRFKSLAGISLKDIRPPQQGRLF